MASRQHHSIVPSIVYMTPLAKICKHFIILGLSNVLCAQLFTLVTHIMAVCCGCMLWVLHLDLSTLMTAAGVGVQWCFLIMTSSIGSIGATVAEQRHDM
jgi:hypothetical protein